MCIKLYLYQYVILRLIHVYFFDISSRMLKVAFPSFKTSKFFGREFPQNPLHVSPSGACWSIGSLDRDYGNLVLSDKENSSLMN